MRVGVLEEQFDLSPADWVSERLTTSAVNVASIIPEGFEAYGRLFHPAHRGETPVSWAEVAAHNGCTVHPEMQWHTISGADFYEPGPPGGPWTEGPDVGSLPQDLTNILVDHLRSHTTTPESVWFATWNGWDGHRLDPRPGVLARLGKKLQPRLRRAGPLPPILELPARHYWLLHGPIEGALETMMSAGYEGFDPWWQSVNLWWPDDRAWFVSTDIDFAWTYVGGAQELIDELLAEPRLEILPATLTERITHDADRINASDPEDG